MKTTTTPSGRMVRTVVTTRSDDGGLAALRDAQEALDEKRLALEDRLEALASGSQTHSLADPQAGAPSGSDGAGSVNGGSVTAGPAKKPLDWRKSLLPKELRLGPDELCGVSRSATLPNEVFQKGGTGKGRKKAKSGARKAVSGPAQDFAPRRGSAATLMQELDRVFDPQWSGPR